MDGWIFSCCFGEDNYSERALLCDDRLNNNVSVIIAYLMHENNCYSIYYSVESSILILVLIKSVFLCQYF